MSLLAGVDGRCVVDRFGGHALRTGGGICPLRYSPRRPPEEVTLRLGHLVLRGLAWGRADGAPLLALHGWLDNAASFSRLAPLLAGRRLVALDLPGHGRSDWRPPGVAYHFVDFVPDVAAAADALGWERFDLLGHSMGAGVATLVAATCARRVRRLVLLEGLGPMSTPAEETPDRLRDALRREGASGRPRPRHADLAAAVEARRRGSDLDRESAALLVARAARTEADGVRFHHDPRLRNPSRVRLTEAQVTAFLTAISCPVLAVLASHGWPFPEPYLSRRQASIRELRVVHVDGGHHVHLAHPERVAPQISRFLG